MRKNIVLLVHGTFAASDDDEGDQWWQRESSFQQQLFDGLPDSFEVETETFHWSGQNKESHRRRAAEHLYYNYLLRYEEELTTYHIIAHSHGGNVVARAFLLAEQRMRRLSRLGSWSTLGTPFFQFDLPNGKRTLSDRISRSALSSLVLGTTSTIGFCIAGLGGANLDTLLFWMGITFFIFCFDALFEVLTGGFRPIIFASIEKSDVAHRDDWLGIWSEHDEAIIGLKLGVQKSNHIYSTLRVQTNTPAVPETAEASIRRKSEWPIIGVEVDSFNKITKIAQYWIFQFPSSVLWKLIEKLFGKTIFRNQVEAILTGNDLSFEHVLSVSTRPDGRQTSTRGLSDSLDSQLLTGALQSFEIANQAIRNGIKLSDIDNHPKELPYSRVPWNNGVKGLVHCRYYEDKGVVKLLQLHLLENASLSISWLAKNKTAPNWRLTFPSEVRKWYFTFMSELQEWPEDFKAERRKLFLGSDDGSHRGKKF